MSLTGLVPDRDSTRERELRECTFEACSLELGASAPVQPIAWIRSQPRFPNCVGEASGGWIDSLQAGPPWASGVSIWREARRRQGLIEQIERGTRLEYAIDGLIRRGWDPYVAGEEFDTTEAGLDAPPAGDDLADELDAYDRRALDLRRYRVADADAPEAVESAILAGHGVLIGTGLRAPFFNYRGDPNAGDVVLDTEHFGGSANGHALRVFAAVRIAGELRLGLQNSHGRVWGGIHLPNGTWQPGCCWVTARVIRECWDRVVLVGRA